MYCFPELPLSILFLPIGLPDDLALVLTNAGGFVRPVTAIRLLYRILEKAP